MKKPIKVLKINVFDKSISEVEIRPDHLPDIYRELECDLFTCIGLPNGDTMYVDDEGLLASEEAIKPSFYLPDLMRHPLVGNALIMGSTNTGGSASHKTKRQDLGTLMWLSKDISYKFACQVLSEPRQIFPLL